MLTLLAGLVAGILHVLTGPDHLATVGTLAIEERWRSWVTGLVWGVGHTSGYSRTVDTHVQRLREKLGQASGLIETVRGAGYRFRAGEV